MADLESSEGEVPEAPASPEPEETPTPEETATSEEKPEAEEGDQDTGEETTDEGSEGTPEDGHGGSFDKLLAKYGGDKDKMASAYFEQANSNARLWERLQAIETYVKGQQEKPEVDEAKLVEEDPDVKEIVSKYNDTHAKIRTTETRQNQLIQSYGTLEKKIEKLRGKLEATVEYEAKQEIRDELGDLVADQKSTHSDIKGTQSDIQRFNEKLEDLKRDYRQAEARAKESVSRQRQAEWERQQEAVATRQEFAEAMRKEATHHGIAVESKQYAVLFQSINDRIYSYLSRLPRGAPGIDIAGAVKALMGEYADSMLKGSFKKASDTKRSAASPLAKEGAAPAKAKGEPPPPKDGRWTKEYVTERAKRLLG
jgi:hypothetical protein